MRGIGLHFASTLRMLLLEGTDGVCTEAAQPRAWYLVISFCLVFICSCYTYLTQLFIETKLISSREKTQFEACGG